MQAFFELVLYPSPPGVRRGTFGGPDISRAITGRSGQWEWRTNWRPSYVAAFISAAFARDDRWSAEAACFREP